MNEVLNVSIPTVSMIPDIHRKWLDLSVLKWGHEYTQFPKRRILRTVHKNVLQLYCTKCLHQLEYYVKVCVLRNNLYTFTQNQTKIFHNIAHFVCLFPTGTRRFRFWLKLTYEVFGHFTPSVSGNFNINKRPIC